MWLTIPSRADAGRTVEIPAEHSTSFVPGRVQGCDLLARPGGGKPREVTVALA